MAPQIMKKFGKLYLHLCYVVQNSFHLDEIFSCPKFHCFKKFFGYFPDFLLSDFFLIFPNFFNFSGLFRFWIHQIFLDFFNFPWIFFFQFFRIFLFLWIFSIFLEFFWTFSIPINSNFSVFCTIFFNLLGLFHLRLIPIFPFFCTIFFFFQSFWTFPISIFSNFSRFFPQFILDFLNFFWIFFNFIWTPSNGVLFPYYITHSGLNKLYISLASLGEKR